MSLYNAATATPKIKLNPQNNGLIVLIKKFTPEASHALEIANIIN